MKRLKKSQMKVRFLHLTGCSETPAWVISKELHMPTEIARTALGKIYKVISSKHINKST